MSNLDKLPCSLPYGTIPAETDAEDIGVSFASKLSALSSSMLNKDVVWRDLFALTGSARTFYGKEACLDRWIYWAGKSTAVNFQYRLGSGRIVKIGTGINWLVCTYTYQAETKPQRDCIAILSLTYGNEGWKIWVIRTVLSQLRNHPDVDHLDPQRSMQSLNKDIHMPQNNNIRFDCAIVGGGQAGLSVAGRLAALGVSYVVLERNKAIGDNWRLRYKSTSTYYPRVLYRPCLRSGPGAVQLTPTIAHLPFDRTFPESYQKYLTKDDLAAGYNDWAQKFNINVWLSTTLQKGRWIADDTSWRLEVLREGKYQELTATHVVMAVGAGGQIPVIPEYPDRKLFRGDILHSVEYDTPEPWKGKNGIVVGTANTAHDVAEDMIEAGLKSVTMIQRSPTYVLPTEYYATVLDESYNINTETGFADMMSYTNPIGVTRLISKFILNEMARREPDRFDRLEKAGFRLVRYGDIIYQLYERFGGHYMDVGASAKIADGLIKIKSNSLIARYDKDGLIFGDGTKIEADVIVYATGFVGNMKQSVKDLFGEEVASRVEDFWGIDHEGEIRGAFKPLGQPHLWLHGGTCSQARFFSRFIALQIQAELDGTPLLNGQN